MIFEQRNPTFNEYCDLRSAVGWHLTEKSSTETALNKTLFSIVVIDNDKAVGMGRIIGDEGLYYYIQDLIVLPDHQHQHIASEIMKLLMDYIKIKANSGAFIGLMATPGLEDFYNSFGFTTNPEGGVGMSMFIQ